jgi:nitrate/nitrite transporter NarK
LPNDLENLYADPPVLPPFLKERTVLRRILIIVALVIAGEMVFGLPFHTGRFFRPTMLEVFGFTNTQLGDLFAVYGVTAMLTYFPGGALADHFSARKLITLSLMATGAGGLYMVTIPGTAETAVLYGFWGVTTIFLFWGALIRSTREWGGESSQGAAFGILESGRGLIAALFAALAVVVFASLMPDDATLATDEERRAAFRAVIYVYTLISVGTAVFVWFVIPEPVQEPVITKRNPLKGMLDVISRPIIWVQALIIVCAYCFYKGAQNWSLYAVQVLGMDEVEAARFTAIGAYVRPIAALAAGLIADRISATWSIAACFVLLIVTSIVLAVITPELVGMPIIVANMFGSLFGVFGLRGVYFALLQDTRTPRHITGAAVGMVSVIGFTPEIFFSPIAGRILDASPGVGGHLNLFKLLAVIAITGFLAIIWLVRMKRNISWNEAVSSDRPSTNAG